MGGEGWREEGNTISVEDVLRWGRGNHEID